MSTYAPAIGDLAWDNATRRVGRVVDHVGGCWRLRPPGGGREWDAHGPLRHATVTVTEALSFGVAPANARSRGQCP
ncbi:hypothetical protein [Streptomyces blattellae]|uniref:hypothetical protein n=1 Tax=Streptomyces blattellae TaxID=2569855 RepID=UPI0012B7593F|nr:hypothetical protein [Streptomyces blattellae]